MVVATSRNHRYPTELLSTVYKYYIIALSADYQSILFINRPSASLLHPSWNIPKCLHVHSPLNAVIQDAMPLTNAKNT